MQIKTRQRVRDLAEVYTHSREVNAMLDLVGDMFPTEDNPEAVDFKFFEPAAGSGNFLEEILRRKLDWLWLDTKRPLRDYEHLILRALASIYAVDIDAENVAESKARLRGQIQSYVDNYLNTRVPSAGFATAVEAILDTNIIRANTLTDLDRIEWVDYKPRAGGAFLREWSTAGEPVEADLFTTAKRDERPMKYGALADHPGPVAKAARKAVVA